MAERQSIREELMICCPCGRFVPLLVCVVFLQLVPRQMMSALETLTLVSSMGALGLISG